MHPVLARALRSTEPWPGIMGAARSTALVVARLGYRQVGHLARHRHLFHAQFLFLFDDSHFVTSLWVNIRSATL